MKTADEINRKIAERYVSKYGADDLLKTWITAADERVRPLHEIMHGRTLPMNEKFDVGGHKMAHPGDLSAPDDLICGCRCTLRIRRRSSLRAAASDQHDGMVIVALPADDDPIREVGDEEMHLTLVWLGDSEEATGDVNVIAQVVADTAQHMAPFMASVSETGELGDDGAWVAHLNAAMPTSVRDRLLSDPDVKAANDSVQQHPQYTPHVTLSYDSQPEASGSIKFDRLALWVGSDRSEYPLEGEAMTDTVTEETTEEKATVSVPWHGVLAPEGIMSGDRRKFAEGSLRNRDLPLPLMYQDAQAMGHDGAVRVARIDGIQRSAEGLMQAWGMFDTSANAEEAARQIDEQMLRGVSVDVDDAEFSFETEDGQPIDGDDPAMFDMENEPVMVITDGRICGATLCSIPAFQEAFVALGPPPAEWGVEQVGIVVDGEYQWLGFAEGVSDKPWSDFTQANYSEEQWKRACVLDKGDGEGKQRYGLPIREPSGTLNRNGVHAAASRFNQVKAPEQAKAKAKAALRGAYSKLGEDPPENIAAIGTVITASMTAPAPVLDYAPSDWFTDPHLPLLSPLTITADGRVLGHLAGWGTCHIGFEGQCVTPPTSAAQYAYFQTGEVLCADGVSVPVGHITMGTGHAASRLGPRPAAEHYDNTGTVVADVAAGEDEFGIWLAGRLRQGILASGTTELRAAALSGDWRRIGGAMELVAALAVNVPGFPIPRTSSAMVAGAQVSLVASGVVPPDHRPVAPELGGGITAAAIARELRAMDRRSAKAQRIAASIGRDKKSRLARAAALRGGQ